MDIASDDTFVKHLQLTGMTEEDILSNFTNSHPPGEGSPFHPCVGRRAERLLSLHVKVPAEPALRSLVMLSPTTHRRRHIALSTMCTNIITLVFGADSR